MENNPLNILAIGRNAEILQVVHRLINAHEGWKAEIAVSDEEARLLLDRQRFDMVLFCAGISKEDERSWRERLAQIVPPVIFFRHYGGGSGLLENEILSALN
jgi:DNA-binding response OmpR family regulator